MFARGRRSFSIGCIALIVVAALHTVGHFTPPPQDAASRALVAALEGYTIEMPLMSTTALAVMRSLSLTMSVTLVALGVLGLAATRRGDAALVRRFAVIYLVADVALVGVFAYYRVVPPLVTLAAVLVAFVIAALPARRPEGRPAV